MKKHESSIEPIALFGGTFDPVHYGHLRCAEEARRKLRLKNLYLLPAGQPPHRGAPQASTLQRLEMLKLALSEFPSLRLDDRETHRDGPSYMVETLSEIRAEYPDRPVLLLIGQDAANLLHTWFDWRQLFSLAHMVILTRPGSKVEYSKEVAGEIERRLTTDVPSLLETLSGKVLQLEVSSIDVSATGIKKLLRQGRVPVSKLPEKVLSYIHEQKLYEHG